MTLTPAGVLYGASALADIWPPPSDGAISSGGGAVVCAVCGFGLLLAALLFFAFELWTLMPGSSVSCALAVLTATSAVMERPNAKDLPKALQIGKL
jgi:hypothetical protein